MKRCPTCGEFVPRGDGRKSTQKYCSPKCWQARNVPPKQELLSELNRTDNITITADLFGADKTAVYRWMKRYGIVRKVVYAG